MRRQDRTTEGGRPLGRRLAWFAGLWLAGVGTVTAVAYLIRLWIVP